MKLPQLMLRDLFWLMLVVAMGLGWMGNRNQLLGDNEQLRKQVPVAAEQARMAAHDWWLGAIKGLSDVDRLYLVAKLALEQPSPDYDMRD
jgi:hypothetical protein